MIPVIMNAIYRLPAFINSKIMGFSRTKLFDRRGERGGGKVEGMPEVMGPCGGQGFKQAYRARYSTMPRKVLFYSS